MYKEFYLMQKEPFDSHPSPEIFFKSDAHQNGWGFLLQGIRKHEPILLVAGEYGAGKTLLYLKLVKLLKKNNLPSVCISTPTYTFLSVLEKILVELGIPLGGFGTDESDEASLQQAIYQYFENTTRKEKNFVYLVIDDAQDFDYSFINKLRLFASYNFAGHFPIRIILFAHHSFKKMLNYKKMVAFGQRIKRIYNIRPFNFEETREYIYFRLIYSGATGTPSFEDEAIKLIQTTSKGSPRLINNVCDNCLLAGSSERSTLISLSLVRNVIEMGNMMGIDQIEESKASSFNGKSDRVPEPDQLPGGISEKRQYATPEKPIPVQRREVRPERENRNEHFRDENPNNSVIQNKGSKKRSPEKNENNRNGLKNIVSRYGKMSLIVILILVIVFLLINLLNQNKSNEMYNLQGLNGNKNQLVQEYLYVVENTDIHKHEDKSSNINKKNEHLNSLPEKEKLVVGKRYQPIFSISKLM